MTAVSLQPRLMTIQEAASFESPAAQYTFIDDDDEDHHTVLSDCPTVKFSNAARKVSLSPTQNSNMDSSPVKADSQQLRDALEVLRPILELVPAESHDELIEELVGEAFHLARGRAADWTDVTEEFPGTATFDFARAETYLKALHKPEAKLLEKRLRMPACKTPDRAAAPAATPLEVNCAGPHSPACSSIGMHSRTSPLLSDEQQLAAEVGNISIAAAATKAPVVDVSEDFESVPASMTTVSLGDDTEVSHDTSLLVNERFVKLPAGNTVLEEEKKSDGGADEDSHCK